MNTLRMYQYLWTRNPLWLYGITSTDPRRDPARAIDEARAMLAGDCIRRIA